MDVFILIFPSPLACMRTKQREAHDADFSDEIIIKHPRVGWEGEVFKKSCGFGLEHVTSRTGQRRLLPSDVSLLSFPTCQFPEITSSPVNPHEDLAG